MKNFIASILMIGLVGTASANYVIWDCKDVYSAAKDVMLDRQQGVPLPDTVDTINNMVHDARTKRILMNLVAASFKRPNFSTLEFQIQEVEEFASQAMLACMKNGL